jgi:hypothetical protein
MKVIRNRNFRLRETIYFSGLTKEAHRLWQFNNFTWSIEGIFFNLVF